MTTDTDRRDAPLTPFELEERLDELLDAALSIRRTAGTIADKLATLDRPRQNFALHWTGVVAKTNPEMGYQFADHVTDAFASLDRAGVEAWIISAMDVYDKKGTHPAIAELKEIHAFAAARAEAAHGVAFGDISGVLSLVVRGLSGRPLELAIETPPHTDTERLYLPERLSRFADRADNQRLYKAYAIHQWAQTWFGTFRLPESALIGDQAMGGPGAPWLPIFHFLETVRLEAGLARTFPGLARELANLRLLAGDPPPDPAWAETIAALSDPEASAHTSLALLGQVAHLPLPPPCCYQGELRPALVVETQRARKEREKAAFREAIARLVEAEGGEPRAEGEVPRVAITATEPREDRVAQSFELTLDGRPIAPDPGLRSLMASIIQDLGEIPDDYLVAAGEGPYQRGSEGKRAEDVWHGTYHEEGAFLYNEWDFRRQHYRKDWCVLREIDVFPSPEPFVEETLRKYSGLAASLRKTFEALRGEHRVLRRQPHGDDVDIDAVVEAYTDMRKGHEMSERLFLRTQRVDRNIAVMFMVDMSGSTKGWINDAERESLVLLCEALEILGDNYAIYGFSGTTRKRCELYRIKRFDESYSAEVRARIAGIKPQDYTRMGVTIRHMTHLLSGVDARVKLLITLSDGKPDDYDGYRGDYGIEDTRQALLEAKQKGIHAFCITIDAEARDYLPHLYGHANYTLIDNVRKLPLRISDIYRHLTQ